LILFSGCFLLNACQKNIDIFVPGPGVSTGPDTTWHTAITPGMPVTVLKTDLLPGVLVDSFDVTATTVTLNITAGLQIIFPPNCCVNGIGQPVTGKVHVEVALLKKKGDLIRTAAPTTYNDSLLVTAGNIFIKLKKDGQALQLAPGVKIYIKYTDSPINQAMKLFVGDETNPLHLNWLPNPDVVNNSITAASQHYEIFTNRQRWINIAYKYEFNNTVKVNIAAGLSNYFTNANTIAFTVLKDLNSVVAMHGDAISRKFTSANVPVGKVVTVVVISKQENDYYLGYESAVAQAPTSGPAVQTVNVVPIKKSLPEIISYLNSL